MWTGCRYSLSPLAAAASRFAPTTPTCFLSIKPTATASHRPGTSARGRSRETIAECSGLAASTNLQACVKNEPALEETCTTIIIVTRDAYTNAYAHLQCAARTHAQARARSSSYVVFNRVYNRLLFTFFKFKLIFEL